MIIENLSNRRFTKVNGTEAAVHGDWMKNTSEKIGRVGDLDDPQLCPVTVGAMDGAGSGGMVDGDRGIALTTRDAYGRNLVGSSLLEARRLVDAGVPFISVHQEIFDHYGHSYDMHVNNFGMLKDILLRAANQPNSRRAVRQILKQTSAIRPPYIPDNIDIAARLEDNTVCLSVVFRSLVGVV